MNTKIFQLIMENLNQAFSLPKYQSLRLDRNTRIDYLPWTPARFKKFQDKIENTLGVEHDFADTVETVVRELDQLYLLRFFGEIWKPNTDQYHYTGWPLVDEVNRHSPHAVLDVGCGYNQFKGRIHNLIGIDPYNNCADYMVDILEYVAEPASYDAVIALGSINFNSQDEIESRVAKCVQLLSPGGRMYWRANPGIDHKNGPWVEIFPWSFEKCYEIAKKFDLTVETFKKDQNRLYWVYQKG